MTSAFLPNRAMLGTLLLAALLTGCGGGGGDGADGGTPSAPTPETPETPITPETPETPAAPTFSLRLNVTGLPEGGHVSLRLNDVVQALTTNGEQAVRTVKTGDTLSLASPSFGDRPTNLFDCILADAGNGALSDGTLTLSLSADAAQAVQCAQANVAVLKSPDSVATGSPVYPYGYGLLRINPLTGENAWLKQASGAGLSAPHTIQSFNVASFPVLKSAILNGELYFPAYTVDSGTELWATDGTDAGTRLVANIRPDTSSTPAGKSGLSGVTQLVSIGDGKLYFQAAPNGVGFLHETDGTSAGTKQVTLPVAPGGHYGAALAQAGNILFFSGSVANKSSLYALESVNGERNVRVLADGVDGLVASNLLAAGLFDGKPRAYFGRQGTATVNSEANAYWLWSSDGTRDGTTQVTDKVEFVWVYQGTGVVDGDGRLFFLGKSAAEGYELWTSDGTAANTRIVSDLVPGAEPGNVANAPKNFTPVGNGLVFFTAYDAAHGREVWKTDGTAAGTALVLDVFPGSGAGVANAGVPANFIRIGDRMVFTASAAGTAPQDLWVADAQGARRVIAEDDARKDAASGVVRPADLGGAAVLYVKETVDGSGTTHNVWLTDGTAQGTRTPTDASGQPLSTRVD